MTLRKIVSRAVVFLAVLLLYVAMVVLIEIRSGNLDGGDKFPQVSDSAYEGNEIGSDLYAPCDEADYDYDIWVCEQGRRRYNNSLSDMENQVFYGEYETGYTIHYPKDWVAIEISELKGEHSSGLRLISPQTLASVKDPGPDYDGIKEDITIHYFDSIGEEIVNKREGYAAKNLEDLIGKEGATILEVTEIAVEGKDLKETEAIKKIDGKDVYSIFFEKEEWVYEINFNYRSSKDELSEVEKAILYEFSPNLSWKELSDMPTTAKPVVYLYPEKAQNIELSLDFDGKLTATYPEYRNGWSVFAYPDGKLINSADGREYSYLFWEGVRSDEAAYDWHEGFVVAGADTASFLQEKLAQMGLTPKEYNEFIVYWMPKMQDNAYNLIHFANQEEYADHARLSIEPQPDSVLRAFMVYKPLDEKISIEPQEIEPFVRKGFSVIEWGGSEIR